VTEKKDQGNPPKKPKAAGESRPDARRKHRHWEVIIVYEDGKHFSRVYIDQERAQRFAERQKSPRLSVPPKSEVH